MKKTTASWRLKNTTYLILSIVALFLFADTPYLRNFVAGIGNLGYLGAFFTGIFFVFTFTVAPSWLVLYYLAQTLNPWGVALLAGAGAVGGDYLIFRFLKDRVFGEWQPILKNLESTKLGKILHTPLFAFLTPLIGVLIIASPFPDELGIGMLGLSKIKPWQFLLLSFALNTLGILIIVLLARGLN